MLHKGPGDINILVNRPKVLEDIVANNYDQYYYMMFALPIALNARTIVETGLCWGHSTRIHLEALSFMDQPRLLITCELDSEKYNDIANQIRSLNLKAQWDLYYGNSVTRAESWKQTYGDTKIDYLYLDSDHSYEHVTNELNAFYPYLSKRCLIMGDDTWNQNEPHAYFNKRNPGKYPTDVYWAFYDWWQKHQEFKILNFSYPEGKVIIIR